MTISTRRSLCRLTILGSANGRSRKEATMVASTMQTAADWAAWVVTVISVSVSVLLLGCVAVGALRRERHDDDAVSHPGQ
jgi:hypothetical protein